MAPQFEPQRPGEGVQLVQGYRDGGFRISGVDYPGAVLITPERTQPWAVGGLDALVADDFAPLLAADARIEVVLIGTGPTMRRPPKALLEALSASGLAVEFMDSKAAARTYNVLINESRRVAAALLPL